LTDRLEVYIGWDSRETIAYDVCVGSIARRTSVPFNIVPLQQRSLRQLGLYNRDTDPLASTEFTYTRFLVPTLCDFKGWALFVDCDFLFIHDISELFAMCDDKFAVMCVKHPDYESRDTCKMDGQTQTSYPRKNWSSLVLYNCGHLATKKLTSSVVNTASGAFLHRFQWLDDDLIGEIPREWNWLEGTYKKGDMAATGGSPLPKAIHYTRGNCYFKEWQDVDYVDLWKNEYKAICGRDFKLEQ
jgi:lipopolysaccharide biosynthesis glycosyltransferase